MNWQKLVALIGDMCVILGLLAIGFALYLSFGAAAVLAYSGGMLVTVGGLTAWRLGRSS